MKIRLVENITWLIDKKDIEVFNKDLLIESTSGKLTCKGILKNAPVTKYTENENGRVYSRPLWSNVKNSGKFEKSLCMADHTDDDAFPSVKNICGVWKNFNDGDAIATADLYCVGEYGALMVEIAQNEGKIGFSTAGYGEFLEYDKKIVNPETYDYESTDWIISPSQGTYFSNKENIVQESENKTENSSNLQESYTNNSKTIDKLDENIVSKENKKEVYMDKSILKNMVKSEITIAKNNPKLVEAIQGLKEVDCAGDAELTGKINVAINEITAKLEESKNITEKQLTEKVSKLEEMTARYNRLSEGYKKARAKVVELSENTNIMNSDISCLTEDCGKRDNDIKCLIEDRKIMRSDIKKMVEKYKALKKENVSFVAKIKEAEEVIGKQEDELEKLGFEFEEEEEELDADGNPVVKVEAPAEEVKEEELPAPEVLPTEAPKPEAIPVLAEEGDEQELPAPNTLPTEPAMIEAEGEEEITLDFNDEDESEDSFEMEEEDAMQAFEPEAKVIEEPVMAEEELPAPEVLPEAPIVEEEELDADGNPVVKPLEEEESEEEKEDEKEEEKPEEKMTEGISLSWGSKKVATKAAPVKTKMVESTLKADLKKFYELQIKTSPKVAAIKEQILGCKNMIDAFTMVQTFTAKKTDKLVKVAESTKKNDGTRSLKW